MPPSAITDAELAVVAEVAAREGWDDLERPPEAHGPRSLAEERAVARFASALPPARGAALRAGLTARIAMLAAALAVLGVCWWVSPARTALGLLGAGLFSLIALRRARRRAARRGPARAGWGPLRRHA